MFPPGYLLVLHIKKPDRIEHLPGAIACNEK